MNGNYEWEKYAAKQRANDYRRQAEVQRQLKINKGLKFENRSLTTKASFALFAAVVLIVIGFSLI